MSDPLLPLLATAVVIGVVHTALGPDHYLPFVVLSRARGWSAARTGVVTALCGVGHVASSVVLGGVGIGLGIAVARLELFESVRGDIAAWLLTAFGLAYAVWGVRRAVRGVRHTHRHVHGDGGEHEHDHAHRSDHLHPHDNRRDVTPWILFTVFLFGPCEPLIPLLMVPAAGHSAWGVAAVAVTFGVATIGTMLVLVHLLRVGATRLIPAADLSRWGHAAAGSAILLCGVAIHLGL